MKPTGNEITSATIGELRISMVFDHNPYGVKDAGYGRLNLLTSSQSFVTEYACCADTG